MDPVKVTYDEEEIRGKTLEDKVNFLIKIAFLNYNTLATQHVVIFGNGDPKKGLCYKVDMHGTMITWMWRIAVPTFTFVAGVLMTHITGMKFW
jgi:hypothetical protein